MQLTHGLPRSDHQQSVAELELFFHQLFFNRALTAAQADHVQAPTVAKIEVQDTFADQLRAGHHRHFGHAYGVGLIDEISRLEVQRFELHALAQAAQVVARGEHIEQQHVTFVHRGAGIGTDHPSAELVLPFDAHYVGAMHRAQLQIT
ncbi:hypothetical protein D3C72_1559040 [compost metagenome]